MRAMGCFAVYPAATIVDKWTSESRQLSLIDHVSNLLTPIRIVIYRENDLWIAHCLEFDLCGHGETQDTALKMLADAVGDQIEFSLRDGGPHNLFSPAEGKFFEMFASGQNRAIGNLTIEFDGDDLTIEDISAREVNEPLACV